MSLKLDIDEYPHAWSKELVDALQDYKNGERNSENNLRKFVNREISEHYYNVLIERHRTTHRINKDKRERKRKKKIKKVIWGIGSFVVLLISFSCTLGYMTSRYGKSGGFWYFFLFIFALGFIGQINEEEFSDLKRENETLKLKLESHERSDANDK